MREVILVAAGGAFGSVLRYLISLYTPLLFGRSSLFTGTMIVNILGCILIGAIIQWMDARQFLDTGLRLFVLVGFLGGFTTYSAFGLEAVDILGDSIPNALLYISLHLVLGIGGVWLGIVASQWLFK